MLDNHAQISKTHIDSVYLSQCRALTTSVGDERYAGMEERKRKRMISNRDSARRSRMRKQKVVEDLSNEITRLRCQNNDIVKKIDKAREGYMAVSTQNSVLSSQAEELTERLRSLISVVESVGCNLDIDDGPGALFQPWHPLNVQHPCRISQNETRVGGHRIGYNTISNNPTSLYPLIVQGPCWTLDWIAQVLVGGHWIGLPRRVGGHWIGFDTFSNDPIYLMPSNLNGITT
ncbi:hypothetical protein Acr_00g0013420 [Actinidia rufa]|uniref:BZIP domain-containing protein n=1 Tax=Actinidia rufa TaxID=165716 RepID=A0A7J0DBE4_9ERIC|nr:hypothetical protein Acr_00g0013420 [Actinidia rufa]